jgi:ABC-type transport system involved in cytochrome c biogenesis permease subunit
VSCMIVATGMLAHFWIVLMRFLRRRDAAQTRTNTGATLGDPVPESFVEQMIPWLVMLTVAILLISRSRMPSYESTEANLHEFGKLPIVYEGRVKPFDTLARNNLRILSNREEFKDKDGKAQPAILWLLDVIADPEAARDHRVFRIDHPQILTKLALERRKKHLYSLEDFLDKLPVLAEIAGEARKKDSKERNADERKALELENKIGQFDLLVKAFQPPDIRSESWQQDVRSAIMEAQRLEQRSPPLAIPPEEGKSEDDINASEDWETFSRGSMKSYLSVNLMQRDPKEPVEHLVEIMIAHQNGEAEEFNDKVRDYHRWLAENRPEELDADRVSFETFFNNFSPFYYSAFSYLFAFIFAVIGLLGWSRPLNRTAFLIILATFCVHTFALVARIYISGRPPVTNLYSSAVFIGWGCVVLGMVFESIYRLGIGNIIGAALGAITLGISHLLAGDGDTFKVLQAVLDTQFWLATHVVCITLGYSTTFLAGALGLYYVLAGFVTKKVTPAASKDLSRMMYGTICFGIFFSFVGTVLGGLWADDSWGRFWGWDPKENGALLIVLWNAILLHANWGKMVGPRGLAVLAVGGNVITSWSWFGVNELSVGLHAYGFTEGVWATLWAFWLSQAVVMIVGVLPTKFWRSELTASPTW